MGSPPNEDASSPLPRRFGNYVLLQRLARGGMGEVMLAKSRGIAGIDKHCVLKVLRRDVGSDAEYLGRFMHEARTVVQLAHRNVCQVFDVGRVGEQHYLAMEHVAGIDLRVLVERAAKEGVTIPIAVGLHVVCEVLEALDYAHRLRDPLSGEPLGLVHRDVSPHNVMVSFEGDVKLIDFGIAASARQTEQTDANVVMGKIAYMSTEQARGEVVDRRADLFAAAVLAYEVLVGERYYEGMSQQQLWYQVGVGGFVPRRWDALDGELQRILARALEPNKDRRHESCAALKDDLLTHQLARQTFAGARELRGLMQRLCADVEQEQRRAYARFHDVTWENAPQSGEFDDKIETFATAPGTGLADAQPGDERSAEPAVGVVVTEPAAPREMFVANTVLDTDVKARSSAPRLLVAVAALVIVAALSAGIAVVVTRAPARPVAAADERAPAAPRVAPSPPQERSPAPPPDETPPSATRKRPTTRAAAAREPKERPPPPPKGAKPTEKLAYLERYCSSLRCTARVRQGQSRLGAEDIAGFQAYLRELDACVLECQR